MIYKYKITWIYILSDQTNLYSPTDVYLWNVSDVQVKVKCRDFMFPTDPYASFELPDIACPLETGKKLHPTDEGIVPGHFILISLSISSFRLVLVNILTDPMCGLQCPDSSYSVAEWRVLVKLTQVGSSLSLICMLFLLISCRYPHTPICIIVTNSLFRFSNQHQTAVSIINTHK
jgi:hypothetical protein